jgi:putative ABC transport system permease protein
MRASASVAVGGVVASLSLAVALTVMVTSFRGSMLDWLDAVLPSPLYLRAAGGSSKSDAALLPPAAAGRPAGWNAPSRCGPPACGWTRSARPSACCCAAARPAGPATAVGGGSACAAGSTGMVAIYVSEAVATLYGVQAGQPWPLLDRAFSTGLADGSAAGQTARLPPHGRRSETHFFIAGIWRDYIRQFGAVAMDWGDYQQLTAMPACGCRCGLLRAKTRPRCSRASKPLWPGCPADRHRRWSSPAVPHCASARCAF